MASGWLLGVAANLAAAGFYDVAVRDVVISFAAFNLARLTDVRDGAPAHGFNSIAEDPHRHVTA